MGLLACPVYSLVLTSPFLRRIGGKIEHNIHAVKPWEQRTFWKLPGYFISGGFLALHLAGFSNKLILNSFCCINSAELFLWALHGVRLLMPSVRALKCFLPVLWGAADLGSIFWPGFPDPICLFQQRMDLDNFSFPHPTYTRLKYCSQ